MVLFDQVIEIFRLADVDGRFTIGIDRGEIGAAFVDGYRLVYTVLDDRFLKVAPGRQFVPMGALQRVDNVGVLVDGPVQLPPFPLDAEVRLVQPPALTNRPLAAAKRFLQHWQQLDGPAVHSRMTVAAALLMTAAMWSFQRHWSRSVEHLSPVSASSGRRAQIGSITDWGARSALG
ncbi:hypothetical protein OKW43_006623 [Paraburkholderia sp. WC7.3g]